MKKSIALLLLLLLYSINLMAQKSVKVYRAGSLIGTFSTLDSAAKVGIRPGDSFLLSPHTFYEHNVVVSAAGVIMQGTLTPTDTTTIDAEYKGVTITSDHWVPKPGDTAKDGIFRDIIFQNGKAIACFSYGSYKNTMQLRGHSIIRNGQPYYDSVWGWVGGRGVYTIYLYDNAKLCNNHCAEGGGAGVTIYAYDSAEICHNHGRWGGAVGGGGDSSGKAGYFYCYSPNVRVHHNTADSGGGAFCGYVDMRQGGMVYGNQAPNGAMMYNEGGLYTSILNCYIYNPRPDGTRQTEIFNTRGSIIINGSWFGQNDTTGLFELKKYPVPPSIPLEIIGDPAQVEWSINYNKPISSKDSLIPVAGVFKRKSGTALPKAWIPQLQGRFSADIGSLSPTQPYINYGDTMQSMYHTYIYPTKGDTSSKEVQFTLVVDADTFRTTKRIWGRDTSNLSISTAGAQEAIDVHIYPNPATEQITIAALPIGSRVQLIDLKGRCLLQEQSHTQSYTLSLKGIAPAYYLLQVQSSSGAKGAVKIQVE